jgi:hypothetical protein
VFVCTCDNECRVQQDPLMDGLASLAVHGIERINERASCFGTARIR